MLTIDQASEAVLAAIRPLQPRRVPLSEAVGRVLAEPVAADLDVPPFPKSLRDGYALRASDVARGITRFRVVGELLAGMTYEGTVGEGEAVRIMTGAPMPPGTDTVVMVEDTVEETDGKGSVVRLVRRPSASSHVMKRGATIVAGEIVLRPGTMLGPAQIGLLAEVGHAEPLVYPRPRAAILSTGDELVEADRRPGPGQIRNSNGPMLAAAVTRYGAIVAFAEHVSDDLQPLREAVAHALTVADCVLLTGGVSMGSRDLVPQVLEDLGVRKVFHRVRMKPGKPLWFGFKEQDSDRTVPVFGLPGNPVSTMVCFTIYVRPALRRLAGQPAVPVRLLPAQLVAEWRIGTDRPTFWPATLRFTERGMEAEPLPWQGSPDLRTLAAADGFVFVPEGDHAFAPGDSVQVVVLD